jgi:signal transduction histidine kinase
MNWPMPSGRLLTRLIAATVTAGLITALLGSILLVRTAQSALRDDALDGNAALARSLAARFDARVDEQLNALAMLASTAGLGAGEEEARTELRAILRASRMYDELYVVGPDGRVLAAAATRFLADPDAYGPRRDIIDTVHEGPFVALREDPPGIVELGVPVVDPAGETVGALVGAAPLDMLQSFLLQIDLVSGTQRSFVDGTGRFLVHPARDRVVAEERLELGEDRSVRGVVTRDGEDILVTAAPTRWLAGALVVEQRETDVLRPAADRIRQLVVLVVAVIAAIVISVVLVGNHLLRHLLPLTEAVNRLGRGERGVRVDALGRDEIGELAVRFNEMSAVLDRHASQLAELERLALDISSRAVRQDLCRDIVEGVRNLLGADGCELRLHDHDPEDVYSAGHVPADQDGGSLTVIVPGYDAGALATLTVSRRDRFDPAERELLESFVAFAGVALENMRRLEIERRLVNELQETVEHRRDLVSTVTHELRTPLVCIQGFSETLVQEWDSFEERDRLSLLGKVLAHARELDDLVGRLLDFSAIERGAMTVNRARVDLRDAIEEVVTSLAPVLTGRPLNFDISDGQVVVDRAIFARTLSNLLSNAAKYSRPGTPIHIRTLLSGDQATVEVIDEGIGMTPDEVQQAFQPFWRAGRPGARRVRGAGIGLSLVAEYVRLLEGTYGVRSEPGRGSTFHFTVPLAGARAPLERRP